MAGVFGVLFPRFSRRQFAHKQAHPAALRPGCPKLRNVKSKQYVRMSKQISLHANFSAFATVVLFFQSIYLAVESCVFYTAPPVPVGKHSSPLVGSLLKTGTFPFDCA